jgi:hypothetical protein
MVVAKTVPSLVLDPCGPGEALAFPVEMGFARSGPDGIKFEFSAQQGFAGGELFVPAGRRKKCAFAPYVPAGPVYARNREFSGVPDFGVLRSPERELKGMAPRR